MKSRWVIKFSIKFSKEQICRVLKTRRSRRTSRHLIIYCLDIAFDATKVRHESDVSTRPNIFHSWVSPCEYAVNLSGGQPQLYWCFMLYWREQMIGNCTYLLRNTRQHIQWTFNSLPWRCLDLELTPTNIHDVTWNPRIAVALPARAERTILSREKSVARARQES